jgi:DNA mismatch repair protein MutL
MSSISILPELLTHKIAAGEVIERPASIVRELLDNSIDAAARDISVEVLYGGRKLIRVVDDGIGMDRDDASLCFERYATSKIKSEDDLFNIHTLGFRGEALSSIAAVSKVTLMTSAAHSSVGTKIEITAGRKKEISDAPPLRGTTIEIRDIFYNTPARKKFLKSSTTEISHIIDAVTQKALSYPHIAFTLRHTNAEIISVSTAKDIRERFIQIYSEELFKDFLMVEKESDALRLYGFVSSADFGRSTRNYQLIFVNRRPIKNPTISHAVYNAYRDVLPKDKHPAFFLFLEIDTQKVDVNVHPAKREVRFESPNEIHQFVEFSVKNILHSQQMKSTVYVPTSESVSDKTLKTAGGRSFGDHTVKETLESALQSENLSENLQTDFFIEKLTASPGEYMYIGESFIAGASHNGLTIIDQHAAHERVLYEKFLKKTDLEVEQLFLPIRVELPVKEFTILMNCRDIFHDLGLQLDDFGANNVIIRSMPRELRKADIKGLLMDTASGIQEKETLGIQDESARQNMLKNIAAGLACHRSVRGKEQLNNEELSRLVSDLERTDVPDKCPHGRPTKVFFSLDDLKRLFKRK